MVPGCLCTDVLLGHFETLYMNNNNFCVIMAGGSANRFWPISRESRPKQFLDIASSGRSLIRMTYDRFSKLVPKENILVVTLDKFGELVQEQIPELPTNNLLLEPYSRNTAPCIAYSTLEIIKRNPDATIVVTPADHIITDEESFGKAVEEILSEAENKGILMTMGITPTGPDTGYGYIQVAGGKAAAQSDEPVKVKTFTEKPDKSLAEVFCKSGEFFWNSGIFAWKASVILEELEKYLPDVLSFFKGWDTMRGKPEERSFLQKAYSDCPKISIDYGVMEKTDRAWLYPVKFGWSDIDSWDSLFNAVLSKDEEGNVSNTGNSLFRENKDNLVITENKRKIYAIKGLKDYLVVDTDDALLICPRDDKQFKDFIAALGMPGYEEFR